MLFPHLYCLKFVSLQNRIKNKVRCCFALNTLATSSPTAVPIPTWNCNCTVTSHSSATQELQSGRNSFPSGTGSITDHSRKKKKNQKTQLYLNLNLDPSVEPRIQRWR